MLKQKKSSEEIIRNRKRAGFKRRINSKLEKEGLRPIELLLEHYRNNTVDTSKYKIGQSECVEIMEAARTKYIGNLPDGMLQHQTRLD